MIIARGVIALNSESSLPSPTWPRQGRRCAKHPPATSVSLWWASGTCLRRVRRHCLCTGHGSLRLKVAVNPRPPLVLRSKHKIHFSVMAGLDRLDPAIHEPLAPACLAFGGARLRAGHDDLESAPSE